MLAQEYYDNIEQDFFMCNVVSSLLDNIAQGFFSCTMLSQEYYDNIEQDFSCALLPRASWATLLKVFTCVILSW